MNPVLEIVVIIVGIVVIANMMKSRHSARRIHGEEMDDVFSDEPHDGGDTRRLRDEVTQLKQRIQVLERIAVEKENSLEREIEQLRDR